MGEREWVQSIAEKLEKKLSDKLPDILIKPEWELPYSNEIRSYGADSIQEEMASFTTDLALIEQRPDGIVSRVIVEAKRVTVTTHDAITYSQKSWYHKMVHPYLRYGIMLGKREHYPLPGRLYRHGQNFDFMFSMVDDKPTNRELSTFLDVLVDEVQASRTLEKIMYESRKHDRDRYFLFHRKLLVE